jgi:hypothetical protein
MTKTVRAWALLHSSLGTSSFPNGQATIWTLRSSGPRIDVPLGAVAQLGERCVRNAEVESSSLFRSTGLLGQAKIFGLL